PPGSGAVIQDTEPAAKDACLETVRKLVRLCFEIRRNGVLAANVLAAKGIVLLCGHINEPPAVQGALLSAALRGFFGADYRERVIAAVKEELRG
ncbi:MAG: hypothetical protein K2K53_12565, partial [Oscillospiraceae bacterium]|nr:hypothetical protein [Oscillospiraceae bacterium]